MSRKINNIAIFKQKVYSQNGEDGILRIIFDKIGTANKFCVEFGMRYGGYTYKDGRRGDGPSNKQMVDV